MGLQVKQQGAVSQKRAKVFRITSIVFRVPNMGLRTVTWGRGYWSQLAATSGQLMYPASVLGGKLLLRATESAFDPLEVNSSGRGVCWVYNWPDCTVMGSVWTQLQDTLGRVGKELYFPKARKQAENTGDIQLAGNPVK